MRQLTRMLMVAALAGAPLASFATSVPALAAGPNTSVPLPFDAGESARIIQGYTGGTHQGASLYGLDLVLVSGETSGAEVLAPWDGSVPWAFAPGEKTGCIEIIASDGKYGTMLCHIILDRPFNRGERVARGQRLGTVGAPGMVGNNGTAHVHMELHVGGRTSEIVPFSTSNGGLPLDGWDLPSTGLVNEHGGEGVIASSNTLADAPAPAPVAAATARPSAPAAQRQAPVAPSKSSATTSARNETHCGTNVKPAFNAGFAAVQTYLGDAIGAPTTCEFADPNGSGDVLQQTSNGLAFWRKSTNTPTFTNGDRHWAFTSGGWVQWTGASVDPPLASLAATDL